MHLLLCVFTSLQMCIKNDPCCEPYRCKLQVHAQCSYQNNPDCCSGKCLVRIFFYIFMSIPVFLERSIFVKQNSWIIMGNNSRKKVFECFLYVVMYSRQVFTWLLSYLVVVRCTVHLSKTGRSCTIDMRAWNLRGHSTFKCGGVLVINSLTMLSSVMIFWLLSTPLFEVILRFVVFTFFECYFLFAV